MQNETTIEIYRDGILEQPSMAERVGQGVLGLLRQGAEATYEASRQVLGDMATSLTLDITDAREGTHLRQDWCDKRRAERIAKVARLYELV